MNSREPYTSETCLAIFLYFETEAGDIFNCKLPPQTHDSFSGGRRYFLLHFLHLTPCVVNERRLPIISLMKCFSIVCSATYLESDARILSANSKDASAFSG